ncbi:MAG: hypothetical protein EGQ16_00875 [Clostridiales bacterium]|nr:hypothetical protein [Clostridiales bacterium]
MSDLPEDLKEKFKDLLNLSQVYIHTYSKVHYEHDKIIKKILENKKEAADFINRAIKLCEPIKPADLINYNKEYITEFFEIRAADVVYKFKNNNVFFLIEHQRKVDYSMPYRIFEYKSEILKSNVDREKVKQKCYKVPLIIAVVIYTGLGNWKVPQNLLQVQEQCTTYLKEQLGINSFYVLEDVNKYTNEELLESNNFLEKIFLLEKSKSQEEVKENFIKILQKLQKEENQGKITKEAKKEFENNIIKILLPKISIKEIKEQLEKINKKGDGQMYGLAVCDMLARENKKIEKRGIIIGKKQGEKRGLRNGIIQVATNMLKAKMDSSTIKNVTGLTDKELKKLEGELLKKVDV